MIVTLIADIKARLSLNFLDFLHKNILFEIFIHFSEKVFIFYFFYLFIFIKIYILISLLFIHYGFIIIIILSLLYIHYGFASIFRFI